MLVVDLHALQSIDVLNLVDEIFRQGFDAHDRQDVVRNRIAVEQRVTALHIVALVDDQVLALRDQIFLRLATVVGCDEDATLRAVILSEFDAAVDLGNDREVFRTTRLEQLGNTRQTAGDVTRFRRFPAGYGRSHRPPEPWRRFRSTGWRQPIGSSSHLDRTPT